MSYGVSGTYVANSGQVSLNAVVWGDGKTSWACYEYASIDAGTWAADQNAVYLGFTAWYNTSAANGDAFTIKLYMPVGTYSFGGYFQKDTTCGILKVYIDAVEVASFDLYAGSNSNNNRLTQTGIAITTAGIKSIQLKVVGKNAASSGYSVAFNGNMGFWRTA